MLFINQRIEPGSKQAENIFAPISRVIYYDTPYSVPSWGFEQIIFHNTKYGDGDFHNDEVVFRGRDNILSHSYGRFGPESISDGRKYLIKWHTYFYAQETGTYTFFGSADDG